VVKALTACLLAITGFVSRDAMAEVDEQTAIALMQETAIWNDLSGVSSDIRQALIAYADYRVGGVVVPASLAKVIQRSVEHISEDSEIAAITSMRTGLDAETVTGVRRWIATPLGQKILSLERSRDVRTYFLDSNHPGESEDAARRTLLAEIVDARKLVEGMRMVSHGRAMIQTIATAAVDPARAISSPETRELPPVLKGLVAREMAANLNVVYSSLGTDEMREYLQYLRSQSAVKLTNLTISTLAIVMKDLGSELERQLVVNP
jgi:hypothetical protein